MSFLPRNHLNASGKRSVYKDPLNSFSSVPFHLLVSTKKFLLFFFLTVFFLRPCVCIPYCTDSCRNASKNLIANFLFYFTNYSIISRSLLPQLQGLPGNLSINIQTPPPTQKIFQRIFYLRARSDVHFFHCL